MFGLGFLLVFALALLAIHFLTRIFPPKARPYAWLAVVALTVSFPFWHYLYPSYREFMELCERPDRYVLLKTIDVDYVYDDGGSFWAYRRNDGHGFKGFEIKQGRLGYFRYSRNESWASPVCQRDCSNPSVFVWEKTCEVNCLTKTAIPTPEFEYSSSYARTVLLEGRLVRQRSAMLTPSGEELAAALNYTYYPYGNGFAKVLGAASGEAPTLSCRTQKTVEPQGFIRPRIAK